MTEPFRTAKHIETVLVHYPANPPAPGDLYPVDEFGPLREVRFRVTLDDGAVHEFRGGPDADGVLFTSRRIVG